MPRGWKNWAPDAKSRAPDAKKRAPDGPEIKVLFRSPQDHENKARGGITKVFHNPDPQLHPFERVREYQRALNAVKLEKIFAKPFVKALDGHLDSVKCMATARIPGAALVSGSCDGELRVWNLQTLTAGFSVPRAHEGFVRGLTVTPNTGEFALSCGDDKTAKLWSLNNRDSSIAAEPKSTFHSASISNAIDHHWTRPMFVTVGDTVDLWDYHRSAPLNSFEWGCERVISGSFNPAEPALIASTAVDRSIGLYDLRGNSAIRKVILKMRSNALCWNPMLPYRFTVANEDCNLYTFDMRKLDAAVGRHMDHTMAVLDVKYNPNGKEFVSASYDATVRMFYIEQPHSREVYHTKRMQRVLCTNYTPDGRFVLTGSEDTNIRVWKQKADAKLGTQSDREKRAFHYREALKEKFENLPEIRRIRNHRHVPKMIKNMQEKRRVMQQAATRKEENKRKHAKPGSVPVVPRKKRVIVKELE